MDHILKLLLCSICLWPAAAAPLYTVQAVGQAGTAYTGTVRISGSGAVAATAIDSGGQSVAMFFDESGQSAREQTDALAGATNSSGAAAGTVFGNGGSRATVWQNGASLSLDIDYSTGLAINDSGAVAGAGWNGRGLSAFVHSGGTTTWIDAGGWSAAYAINNQGQAAGTAEVRPGSFEAFLWSGNGGVQKLGTLGGRSSYASALNESGVVVGTSMTRRFAFHAFRFDGEMHDLGTLGGHMSAAYGVNSSGAIVGYSTTAEGVSHAFVWRDGMLFDLNALVDPGSGWTLESAYGINDLGQIAGVGTYQGRSSLFVLNPVAREPALARIMQGDAMPVPEPATWISVSAGVALLAAAIWRRRSC